MLRVRGNSMIDEQIRDGDFVVVNERHTADNGEMVIALVDGTAATVKKFYRERDGRIRLQPANETMSRSTCTRTTSRSRASSSECCGATSRVSRVVARRVPA